MLNKEKKKIGGLVELSNWVDIEKLEKRVALRRI